METALLIGVPLAAGVGLLLAGGRILRKPTTQSVSELSPESPASVSATPTWPSKLGGCLVLMLGLAITGVGLCFGIVSAVSR